MIFIVDDDAAIRESLRFLLSCEGLEARSFASGSQFLDSCTPSDADCLITDVDLPGMDGLELLRTVRDRGLELAVIVMTGHPSAAVREQARMAGASAFLEKPLEASEILGLVRGRPPAAG